jgi:hypothetical protein
MYKLLCTALFLTLGITSFAQKEEELFAPGSKTEGKHGFILNFNGGVDIPAADMAKRFGTSYRVGPALSYKTSSNWLFGGKADFILGNITYQDSLFINARDKYSTQNTKVYQFINGDGQRVGVPIFERGYALGLFAGKIISFSDYRPDNGLVLITTAGFIQHKIRILDKSNTVTALRNGYNKGYDRLTNGVFIEQYAGYIYFAKNKLLNFSIGADVLVGFTQGRRDYLFDVMRPDNKQRLDILFGLRGSWFIPIFKRNSEELIFE